MYSALGSCMGAFTQNAHFEEVDVEVLDGGKGSEEGLGMDQVGSGGRGTG